MRSRARSPSPVPRVQWLRDQLQIIRDAAEIETLARQVDSASGMYFVPLSPGSSRPIGALMPVASSSDCPASIPVSTSARAALEAICYQSRDVVEAMQKDAGVRLEGLKVDGGVTVERAVHADSGRHPRR